jgi:hypothetical protein
MMNPKGRVNYEPNLQSGAVVRANRPSWVFVRPVEEEGAKLRVGQKHLPTITAKRGSFIWLTNVEQNHIAAALTLN